MKRSSPVRASHVNAGTSIPRSDLTCPWVRGRAFRGRKLDVVVESSEGTALGGLALATGLCRSLGAAESIDRRVSLLRSRRPFHESDHVLTHVYNLFVGGTAIEDIADLQQSEAVRRMLGTPRIPDPTTAGDFLRRFDRPSIAALDASIDEMQERVWHRRFGRKRSGLGIVDLDSHLRHVYGHQKEGADFTYKGGFGYHPLVISLAETQECLRLINRPGNKASAEGAAAQIESLAPMLRRRFESVLVRGDSAFARQDVFDACDRNSLGFAMVSGQQSNFEGLAESLNERAWRAFRAQPPRGRPGHSRRRRGRDLRRRRARERGKRDLELKRQWVAEIPYKPARSERVYRLIIRRQRIQESMQGELFEVWRYRYVLTNMSGSISAEDVVRLTYRRCDQENVIEQLQNGVAAMRMPTGGFLANWAHLVCARLAHNLKSWLAQLVLPREATRWEWKRFRKAFVYIAARVVRTSRRTVLRLASSHRFASTIQRAVVRLQT